MTALGNIGRIGERMRLVGVRTAPRAGGRWVGYRWQASGYDWKYRRAWWGWKERQLGAWRLRYTADARPGTMWARHLERRQRRRLHQRRPQHRPRRRHLLRVEMWFG